LEKGDKRQVGVNVHAQRDAEELEILRISHQVELDQRELLGDRRAHRDQAEVDRRLADMVQAARGGGNLVVPMLAAARAEATLGEICDALRAEWGEYREPARF
jgi:methylmalonyl-CoA mutase N-terminal domain/subunit